MANIPLLRNHISRITEYLTPLLPLAHCHMVEFLTECHWDKLLPEPLRGYLEGRQLDDAVEEFWQCHNNQSGGDSALAKWISEARSHYVQVNDKYCITNEQLEELIQSWGGARKHEIIVTEFMTQKKSYEVQTMSRLVAELVDVTSSTVAVEAGGGRGPLLAALGLGYRVPSLTVDCNERAVRAAERRLHMIKKQWHVIARRADGGVEARAGTEDGLHRFAATLITEDTRLAALAREHFPGEHRLLLTGLHTCGDLGPVSLRLFSKHSYTAAVFNVPCCYHLLAEESGFPMSQCLKGYKLSRNARMLANHSIERVVYQRQLPARSLLYRAMLELIIKTYIPEAELSTGKLKRISKVDSFEQYFKRADAILNMNIFESVPDLSEIIGNEVHYWKKLVLFYLVKLCLSQVVESLILLDRIMYLYENDFDKVYLVKLFDPVLSPRCHSIVAVR